MEKGMISIGSMVAPTLALQLKSPCILFYERQRLFSQLHQVEISENFSFHLAAKMFHLESNFQLKNNRTITVINFFVSLV